MMKLTDAVTIFAILEIAGFICGQIFIEMYEDQFTGPFNITRACACIASLIPGINLIVIYATIKGLVTKDYKN